ncbi:MAG: TonB family protein [Chitinophagaceae bacterium]|nr:TonB family protein [Rubrivivax sp.]
MRTTTPAVALALTLSAWLAACSTPAPTVPRNISLSSGKCAQPGYPAEARRSEASGSTEMEFEVNAEGKVTRVAIVKPSGDSPGHQVLDAVALATLRQCSFPATPGFLPASSRMTYLWRLQD